MAGASILELAYYRAAWARAAAPTSETNLFEIQKVANAIYFAQARPQAMLKSNAAIFVRSKDVVVVDTHSKLRSRWGALADLISQLPSREEGLVLCSNRSAADELDFELHLGCHHLLSRVRESW